MDAGAVIRMCLQLCMFLTYNRCHSEVLNPGQDTNAEPVVLYSEKQENVERTDDSKFNPRDDVMYLNNNHAVGLIDSYNVNSIFISNYRDKQSTTPSELLKNIAPEHSISSESPRTFLELKIHDECMAILYDFVQASSNFTVCVIENSDNCSVCQNCYKWYYDANHQYENILAYESPEGPKQFKCKDEILKKNRMLIVEATNYLTNNAWNNGSCNECFVKENGTITSNFTTDLSYFYHLLEEFNKCVANYSLLIENNTDATNHSEICTKCITYFVSLRNFYSDLFKNYSSICMDIRYNMRKAHLIWDKYECIRYQFKGYPVFILSGIICLLPVILYVAAKSSLRVKDIQIVNPSRIASIHSTYSLSASR